MGFVNLHVHTHYSLLDGMNRIGEVVARAVDLNQQALAMTDHGNVAGMVKFYQACKQAGITPIIGMEAYVVPDRTERKGKMGEYNHLILLAHTSEGLANLIRISSDAYQTGFYYKPRTDASFLAEHSTGLIATSACLNGELSEAVLAGDLERAHRIIETYKELFPGRYYIEIQSSTYEEQWKVNPVLVRLAKEHGVPFVVTGDCHYTRPEDHDAHDLLLAIQTGSKKADPNRLRLPTADYWLKDEDSTLRILLDGGLDRSDAVRAIDAAFELAARCEVELPLADTTGVVHYPAPSLPPGTTAEELLDRRSREGLLRYLSRDSHLDYRTDDYLTVYPAYWQRLDYELAVLKEAGLAGYFLVEQEIVAFCRQAGIPHMARGSAGGSLVAFALGITSTDPIRHRLSFERFYVPGRKGRPDIDLDVDASRRQEVLDWVVHRFGSDHTALIAAYASLNPRALIRDVGRSLGYPYQQVDALSKQIPQSWTDEESGEKVQASFSRLFADYPEIKALAEHEDHREIFAYAQKLEGLARHASIHAGGVIISPTPLDGQLPLMRAPRAEEGRASLPVSQLDMEDVEALGFLKFDILGVDALTVRARTLDLIRRRTGSAPDLDSLDLSDPAVYDLLKSGRTYGVFQVGTSPGRRACQIIQPDNFDELIDLLSLMRPGPANNGFLELYAKYKSGRDAPTYIHPEMARILGPTHGVMVYQEQILDIVRTFAGFSHAEADAVRKAVGKKLFDKLSSIGEEFTRRAVERGMLTREQAQELWSQILKFGSYTFNRAHACAYAYLAYQTAWLKCHYPADFMAAVLANEANASGDDRDSRVREAVQECHALGIQIRGPHINESEVNAISTDEKTILLGLGQVRFLDKAASVIVEKRPYKDLEDFLSKHTSRTANKKVVTVLIASGAFDWLNRDRLALLRQYEAIRTRGCRTARQVEKASLGRSLPLSKGRVLTIPAELTPAHVAAWETMLLSFPVSSHPAGFLEQDDWRTAALNDEVRVAGYITRVRRTVTKKGKHPGQEMAFCDLDIPGGRIIRVVLFPEVYRKARSLLKPMGLLYFKGRKDAPDAAIVNEVLEIPQEAVPF